MGADGHVVILDKAKAEEWAKEHNERLVWFGWHEYEIYGHKVMVCYYGDYPQSYQNEPCPFCESGRDCDDYKHWKMFEKLKKYASVGDWEVWT